VLMLVGEGGNGLKIPAEETRELVYLVCCEIGVGKERMSGQGNGKGGRLTGGGVEGW
jgi:hypothetical protein